MADLRPIRRSTVALLWVQGTYYSLTGIWPLVSVESFQQITGRKTDHLVTGNEGDHWLVMTVAVLVLAIGLAIVFAAWRRACPAEIALLAILSALGLTGIDIVYVYRGAIPPVYLVDAVAEVLLLLTWSGTLLPATLLRGTLLRGIHPIENRTLTKNH